MTTGVHGYGGFVTAQKTALAVNEPSSRDPVAEEPGRTRLTPRQAEVVRLAQRGLSAKEIARHLGISKRTVEDHFSGARQRTGAASTVALVGQVSLASTVIAAGSGGLCSEIDGFSEQPSGDVVSPPPYGPRSVPRAGRGRGRPTVMTDDLIA